MDRAQDVGKIAKALNKDPRTSKFAQKHKKEYKPFGSQACAAACAVACAVACAWRVQWRVHGVCMACAWRVHGTKRSTCTNTSPFTRRGLWRMPNPNPSPHSNPNPDPNPSPHSNPNPNPSARRRLWRRVRALRCYSSQSSLARPPRYRCTTTVPCTRSPSR